MFLSKKKDRKDRKQLEVVNNEDLTPSFITTLPGRTSPLTPEDTIKAFEFPGGCANTLIKVKECVACSGPGTS